jgi:hypothetical protein
VAGVNKGRLLFCAISIAAIPARELHGGEALGAPRLLARVSPKSMTSTTPRLGDFGVFRGFPAQCFL